MASNQPAYIGLGSNLNNPIEQLKQALEALEGLDGCAIEQCSPLYWSTAVGPGEQPDYLNGVVHLQTRLSPQALLNALRNIEDAQGRTREIRWGARTLDLDLLLYDDLVINSKELTIPHPHLHKRNFVVYPLYDIAPMLRLPDGRALSELVNQLPSTGLRPLTDDL
ncbi:MAG: 2-amino-4-hydroxy-6-hydroxymethyldihydropteridine diphosphokinase [Pseudomonadales bacterium]